MKLLRGGKWGVFGAAVLRLTRDLFADFVFHALSQD
jgi:hypothetical protein